MKDHKAIPHVLRDYFTICTCSLAGSAAFLTISSIKNITYALLWQILFVSLVTSLTSLIYHSKHELSKKSFLIRSIIQYFMINAILLFSAYFFKWVQFTEANLVLTFVTLVFLIYALVHTIIYFDDRFHAKLLNEKLSEYKKKRGENIAE